MKETQETVNKWQLETFGQEGSLQQVIQRLREELDELEAAEGQGDFHEFAMEVADVQIVLWELAAKASVFLPAAVDAKMKTNRARTWKKSEDGQWRHV